MDIKKLLSLFSVFFKIGLFTFGGGYAMIPLIQKAVVEDKKWITEEDMLDMVAISQSTPGVIAVNMATFVGYKTAGTLGAAVSTIAVALPSLFIITVISFFIEEFGRFEYVAYAFRGIRAGVVVLILNAVLKLGKSLEKNIFNISVICVSFVLSAFLSFDTIILLVLAAICGLLYSSIKLRHKK